MICRSQRMQQMLQVIQEKPKKLLILILNVSAAEVISNFSTCHGIESTHGGP